ncbi:MAG: hypothetical protein LBR41_02230, partial [Rickettsiales bacterium]|nr:hypothetical protein [Rickettsiales bacterium]
DIAGNLSVGGTLDNTGGPVTIGATGDITVAGTMNAGGDMLITAANLSIAGGDALNPSLVSKGNFHATITGNTSFASSINLTDASAFYLDTGSLTMTREYLTALVQNNLNNFYLKIHSGWVAVESLTNTGASFDLIATEDIDIISGVLNNSGGARIVTDADITVGNNVLNTGTLGLYANAVSTHSIVNDGTLAISTSHLSVAGNMGGSGATHVSANPDMSSPYLTVDITGNLSGASWFTGLSSMTVGGNYTYENGAGWGLAVLNSGMHFATVNNDPTSSKYGEINNTGANAMINVGGTFGTDISGTPGDGVGALAPLETGLTLFSVVDTGTAIWLLHADGGILGDNALRLADLPVRFCNLAGTDCFDVAPNQPLPGYIRTESNDIYLVFDDAFTLVNIGLFKIQPVVGATPGNTKHEYQTAGAIDNLIAAGLAGWDSNVEVGAISHVFSGTIFENMASELVDWMRSYSRSGDGTGLTEFSRAFQPNELPAAIATTDLFVRTYSRDFASRMTDEFMTIRNRNRKRVWADATFGTNDMDGNQLIASVGFDWQSNPKNIFGLAAHFGNVSAGDVQNTAFGLGGYWIHSFMDELKIYGNLFFDLNMIDMSHDQVYMGRVSGDANVFGIVSEWGLMHDIINKYVVGNLYVRLGYRDAIETTETVRGSDYMNIDAAGGFSVTPGYELSLQKRIYMSSFAWLRPRISAGVEYDVLGLGDAQFKFAPATKWTDYDSDINPLWSAGRAGLDFAGASGWQFGVEYEYKYNADITANNFRLHGMLRF